MGCGHGASTILMAEAYPRAQFVGFDVHEPSIRTAREQAGSLRNLGFEVATAHDFAGEYDLVTMFDALHDMGDPVGAARRAREVLKPGGALMLVEPMAGDRLQDNLNPLGRSFYAFSTSFCVPGSMSQPVAAAPGRPGGRGQAAGSGPGGRIHALPACGADPVQHGARSPRLTARKWTPYIRIV